MKSARLAAFAFVSFAMSFAGACANDDSSSQTAPSPASTDPRTSPANVASCSTRGTTPLTVTFVNQRAEAMSLYWVDEDCVEKLYATLAGGESGGQATFVGHMWRVREGSANPNGTLVKEFVGQATDAPATTVIIPPLPGVAPVSCSAPGTTAPVIVTVANQRSTPLSLFWVDTKCRETFRATLPRGKESRESTFVGHLFRVREGTESAPGALVREIVVAAGGAPVVIAPANGESPTICSSSGGAELTLTVTNATAAPVSLFWIDSECTPLFRETIQADAGAAQKTYAGHVWQVRAGAQADAGALLTQFVPQASDAPVMAVSVK